MIPLGLHITSEISLAVALLCALAIGADELRRPQTMWIMNLVWPLCALFGSVLWLAFYLRYGRMPQSADGPRTATPFAIQVAKAASHCGAGCTLGDMCAEGLMIAAPSLAVWFGLGTLFRERVFAGWIFDFVLAYAFGIVFQYFTIAPMRKLGFAAGLWAAVKADTLSLIAWQVGMYAVMAIAHFWLFRSVFHVPLQASTSEFWLVMQIAMIFGFVTSYPVNVFLLRAGLKEKM